MNYLVHLNVAMQVVQLLIVSFDHFQGIDSRQSLDLNWHDDVPAIVCTIVTLWTDYYYYLPHG